jgi:subtilisin family serine protease
VPDKPKVEETGRLLVKLRPSNALRAAESNANLRPLHEGPAAASPFAADAEPQWYLAELPEGGATPWDSAHARVGAQLGVAEADVLFAEPDMLHNVYVDANEERLDEGFAAGDKCDPTPQDAGHGKPVGPAGEFAWHLGDNYTQLGSARAAVNFTEPRTRIAHIDTGYYRSHDTVPEHTLHELGRSFVDGEDGRNSAEDPDNRLLVLDNSGHGTGTIGILAGGRTPAAYGGEYLGGAPQAEVLPLRISDRVVLIRTSALARALRYAVAQRCDVVTLSMGGLPSDAWAEEVDKAYEAGVCICAAAGNHVNFTPPRVVVYPARYPRVLAVCGVMEDGRPYTGLDGRDTLQGSFGPASAMGAAIAAYTPNIPWPRFLCGTIIRLNGEGTSAATPQVAAAAALWLERYKNDLRRDWRRVEAVRHALFSSARGKDAEHFGKGILQARDALDVKPFLDRPQSPRSNNSFAFLRLTTGLGLVEQPPRERMFNLELAQRWLLNEELQKLVPDPENPPVFGEQEQEREFMRRVMEAIIEDPGASLALRRHMIGRFPLVTRVRAPRGVPPEVVPPLTRVCDKEPSLTPPPYRRVRVYATDPSFSTRLETASINEVALKVRWEEELEAGPTGEYLAVAETDADGEPILDPDGKPMGLVNLDDKHLLAQDGWAPSEGNPQFHQQMVYAVAMKTIEHFENALGRPVLWRHRKNPDNDFDDSQFVRRLAVRPHALRQANAFYSPDQLALLFGYFEAAASDPGRMAPGSRVYSCLSHDIVAHETTHAILDGMHRRFNEPTNYDVLALHEAFADVVALMQHFTIPEVLEQQIARTRGDLETESSLGSLAIQFGYASSGHGALREAIGRVDESGRWVRIKPDPAEYQKRLTPHARGAVLVGAIFDAFLAIYKSRTEDLIRIYTGGTGVLPSGAIHPDLVRRLAEAASKSARHVLNMCIRALDYIPPVDITFGEYLRGIITADFDYMADDRYNYRVAFVEAFRARGIYPRDLDTLSVDTLRWQGLDHTGLPARVRKHYDAIVERLKRYSDACLYIRDREKLFRETRSQRAALHAQLETAFKEAPKFAAGLGISPKKGDSKVHDFEVHALRRSLRTAAGGNQVPQVVVELTQSREIAVDGQKHTFRGGSTLVVDLLQPAVKYRIQKDINSKPSADGNSRFDRTVRFIQQVQGDALRALFFAPERPEPFAALHTLADDGF